MSRRKMAGSSVAILMTVIYHTPTKSRAMTQQVTKVKHGTIPAGDTDIWEGEKLCIPPLPPSNLNGCSIINVKYTLELRVDPVGPAFDLHVPMEIIIGTIPLRSAVQRYVAAHQLTPPPPQRNAPSHPAGHPLPYPPGYTPPHSSGNAPPYSAASALPHLHGQHNQGAVADPASRQQPVQYHIPPRFAHYVFGHSRTHDEDDDENTRGDSHFTPVYVYYTWQPDDLHVRRQQGVRFAA